MRGAHKAELYRIYAMQLYTAHKALNSFLLVRRAHGHTYAHTHTQEMVADAFNKDFSSEGQMS